MKALSQIFRARVTPLRLVLAALVLGVFALALSTASSVAAPGRAGHTGQALALRAALKPGGTQAQQSDKSVSRFVYDAFHPLVSRPAARRGAKALAAGSAVTSALVSEPVQTFDVFAPPPAFTPTTGDLTPDNRTPVFTSDVDSGDKFIIFSSNRAHVAPNGGTVNDGTFHLWSIAVNDSTGASLTQITTSTGSEFFPALNPVNNQELAFTSTAGNGTTNLYAIDNFSPGVTTLVNVNTLTSPTIRNTAGDPNNTNLDTGFSEVLRPTWSPDGLRIAFSALDNPTKNGAAQPFPSVHHIYFLYAVSGGGANTSQPTNTNPPAKLTEGPGDDTDPAWFPIAGTDEIAFASTATTIGTAAPATTGAPDPTRRSLFLITATGTGGTRITNATGADDFGPAWNPSGSGQLAFARRVSGASRFDIYFRNGFTTEPATAAGNSTRFNTDDNAGEVRTTGSATQANAGNAYNDVYPTWSLSQTIGYASSRSVTYNNPTTGAAAEQAISLDQGSTSTAAGYSVGAGYMGILISRLNDVDPPTLLPFSTGEVVHVTNAQGAIVRSGDAPAGSQVTFTVRLSNREAGVDDNNVYLQIKDPDSKYQDAQSVEHKVFARDLTDFGNQFSTDPDSGSALSQIYNGGAFFATIQDDFSPNNGFLSFGNYVQTFKFSENNTNFDFESEVRGEIGGNDGGTPIAVGRIDPANAGQNPVTFTANNNSVRLAGPDPANFQVLGQEYECQFVHADFNTFGAMTGTGDTGAEDYGRPYYLAGVDDQGAHTGGTHPPRIAPNTAGAEWLRLTRAATQDGQGGVLYTAAWTTPMSVSDYYLDVIAYDKATTTSFPASTTAVGVPSANSNFRIYDNVWGFSTQPFATTNNILVVSDNALGQKFVGTTFGGSGLNNIPTSFYGTESYFTGIDVSLLPNAIFRNVQVDTPVRNGTPVTPKGHPVAQVLAISPTLNSNNLVARSHFPTSGVAPVLNGLGTGSYSATTQAYSLWRVLSRGSVPQSVLNAYLPNFESQPAVNDPEAGFQADAATVPVANRCVLWFSPYAGDLPLNVAGSIVDANTQTSLRAYVDGGGRLMVSGQNVASTLSAGGVVDPTLNAAGSFLVDVLNAKYVTGFANNPGSENLSGGGGRITGDSYFNPDANRGLVQRFFTSATDDVFTFGYSTPSSLALILGNNYVLRPIARTDLWRTDGSLSQLGPALSSFGNNVAESQIGVIQAQNGATVDLSIVGPGNLDTPGTGPGLVYKPAMNANGARVVFASASLEGIGTEFYKASFGTEPAPNNNFFYPRNQRPNVLHNVVTFLRTGTATGTISATNTTTGTTGPVAGATVYLTPDSGVDIPGYPRKLYSATTTSSGAYAIHGIEPGGYIVRAYKNGFRSAQSLTFLTVTAATTSTLNLSLTPVTPGIITGTVVDQNGKGFPGATVSFTTASGQTATGTTNPNGTYTISNVVPGTYSGTASATGFSGTTVTSVVVQSGKTTSGINFTLSPTPGTLGGLVKDAFINQPLAGATIRITTPTGGPVTDVQGNTVGPITTTSTTTSPTSPNGDASPVNYSNTKLLQGTYKVTITPPAGFSNPTPPSPQAVMITGGQFTRLDFTFPGGALGGLVTNSATGNPIAGAKVTVMQGGTTVATFTTGGTATSPNPPVGDSQPLNFSGSVPPGTYTVTVSAPNFFTQTSSNVTVAANAFKRQDAALVSSLGTLAGLVTDSFTKQPLGNAKVVVQDSTDKTVATFTTDANGGTTATTKGATGDGSPINYGPATLPQGAYTVIASATDHTTQTITATVTAGQFKRQDIALVSTLGTVGGLVTDSTSGQPLAGATVTITDAAGATVYTTTTGTPAASPTDTRFGDGQPVSYIKTLTQGVYTVSVTKTDPNSPTSTAQNFVPTSFTVTVSPNVFARRDVALVNANGTLGGLVTDSTTGQPLSGATVTILDADGNTVKTLTSRTVVSSPGAPVGDSKPLNFSATLLRGTYTVTVAATDHRTIGPVTVVVVGSQFKRQDFPLVSTLGTVGGLVTDSFSGQALAGVTVTVKDAANVTVATLTTTAAVSSPAAPQGDGQPLNYSGTVTQGTYTVTVSRRGFGTTASKTVTVVASRLNRVDFTGATGGLPPLHVFPAGLNFVSLPFDYAGAGVGFDALFGTLNPTPRTNPGAGGNRSHVYVWNPQMVQYVADPVPPADAPRLGQGYWVYLINAHEVTVPGNPAPGASVSVPLGRGWNMIGVPSQAAVGVSALTFTNAASGARLTFDQASGSAFKLVSPTLYGFDGAQYVPLTAGGAMQPYQSYWIYAFANTSVNLPTGGG